MGKMSLENVEDYFSQEDLEDEPSVEDMKKELTNCIYLQDSSVTICGLKIYGTPWQPEFCGWAFNLPRGQVSAHLKFPAFFGLLIVQLKFAFMNGTKLMPRFHFLMRVN